MELDKLRSIADLFLGCLNEIPEHFSGEATIILQDLIQKAMVKLSKGKVRTIIFEAVKESALAGSIPGMVPSLQQQESASEPEPPDPEQQQEQPAPPAHQHITENEPAETVTVGPAVQTNQELDNWVTAMLYEETPDAPPSPAEADEASKVAVSMKTETVVTEARRPGRPRKQPGPSIVDNYNIVLLSDGNKMFECGVCKKHFKDKSNMGRHLRTHVGERAFPCPFCQKAFTQKVHMQSHMRIHTGERPYSCQTCGKTFATRRSIDQHNLIHSQIKRFKCNECGKAFAFKQKLRMHMQTHTGEKPHQCLVCKKGFSRHEILKSHKCAGHPARSDLVKAVYLNKEDVSKENNPAVTAENSKPIVVKRVPVGRPLFKRIKVETEDKVQPVIKKEKTEESETQETNPQTVVKPVTVLGDDSNEICFEIIAHHTGTDKQTDNDQVTIVQQLNENQQDTKLVTTGTSGITLGPVIKLDSTGAILPEDGTTTVIHDISSLPESLQALVQAATSVTIPTQNVDETVETSESDNRNVIEIITGEQALQVSDIVELDAQNMVVSTVEEIVEDTKS